MKISGYLKFLPLLSVVAFAAMAAGITFSRVSSVPDPEILSGPGQTVSDTLKTRAKKTQDSLYAALLVSAEKAFVAKDYGKSIADLEKAQSIRPGDSSVKEKLSKARGLLAEQNQQHDAFAKAMESGDAYFKTRDYLNAKSAFQVAVGLNPNDPVAKEKLQNTMNLLRSQKAQNILFDVAVASADKLFQSGEYEKAKLEYENASKLLPGDPYPKNKINEIIKILVDKQVKDEEFAKAIASADKFYLQKNYPSALLDYKKANGLKPGEKYPEDRIKELTDILAALKARDESYKKAVGMADQYFSDAQYPVAVNAYQDALSIKPEEKYPREKIKEIEGIIARNKAAQEDYDRYVNLADSLYIGKQYLKARENYLMATSVKPSESYPKEMVAKADKMLTGQEAAMAKALEEQYAGLIAGADKLLTAKSLEPARAEYMKASNLKPGEKYPKDKIGEIDALIANALKDKEEQYKLAVASADQALADKKYETAKTGYQNALLIKPNETYPKQKIAEVEKLIAAFEKEKAGEEKYRLTIMRADSLLMAKMYEPAKAGYQDALKMKPAETYPKTRISEINLALADLTRQKTLDNQYAAIITKADGLLAARSFNLARAQYQQAGDLKPAETYPKDKIAEIDKILEDLAAAKAFEDHYVGVLDKADKQLAAKEYEQARLGYQSALSLKPSEQYPKDKIAEIDRLITELAARASAEENYKATLARADQYFEAKNYETAKIEYTSASNLKPAEKYPKDQLARIATVLAELERQKAAEENYAATIARADKLLSEQSYEPALAEYQTALKIKPAEAYPKTKADEIMAILTGLEKQKTLDARYAGVIAKADKLLTEKAYPGARAEYVNAAALKPAETYPQEKIAGIDKILADLAAAKALDEQYAGIVAGADKLFAARTYEQAKSEYQNALKLKPAESYPAARITEIDRIFADQAAAKALDENYAAAIAGADKLFGDKNYEEAKAGYARASELKPAEQYPKEQMSRIAVALAEIARQKTMDENYSATVARADKLLSEKSYEPALAEYQAALRIKPGEQYPKGKSDEITAILANLEKQKALDARYSGLIEKADKLLDAKDYPSARSEYVNASALKPAETYPKDKITGIDKTLADIAAAKALDEKYAGIIAGADKLFTARTYDQSKAEYQNALKVKPSEAYPAARIAEIDKIIADQAAAKALDDDYTATIAGADKQFGEKKYDEAKSGYVKASGLKPAEQYPKEQIIRIESLLAEIARQKALDDEYAATVASADNLLKDKSYEAAKEAYLKASALKSAEQYPRGKVAEIDKTLAEMARLKAIEDQYAAAISGADKLFTDKDYEKAKAGYLDAGKIKPGEQYPRDKVTEINGLLAEIARQKALDDQYRTSLQKADQLLDSKSYDQARAEYANAGNLKPQEQYPKSKIEEIDGILAEIKAREDAYKAAIANGDQLLSEKKYENARTAYQNALEIKPQAAYPKEKIVQVDKALEELLGKQKYYDNLVASGDEWFRSKDFPKAKDSYQQALGVFPDKQYPKDRINVITNWIDSLYRANKSRYDKAVSDGDRYFGTFEFDKAIDAYADAAGFLPMEAYPRDMIAKIRRTIAENAIADVLKTPVVIPGGESRQFAFTPVNIASRKNNFIYIKIKNLSGKPFTILMRYGKDKQANGGVVMKSLTIDGRINERLVSVRDQDLWSREDNNWISLLPQGGDVEVSFIQVSRAVR